MRRVGWAACLPLLVCVLVREDAPIFAVIERARRLPEKRAPRAPLDQKDAAPVGRPLGLQRFLPSPKLASRTRAQSLPVRRTNLKQKVLRGGQLRWKLFLGSSSLGKLPAALSLPYALRVYIWHQRPKEADYSILCDGFLF